jgi:predicted transcriptional regulator
MRIDQIMSQPAITCRHDDTLNTAARLMWENDCGVLPVVDDDGRLVGMVTDRDICMSAYTQGKPLHELPVASTMAKRVFSCRPQDSVSTAEKSMSEAQIRRMPVVDDGNRPIGMLSLNDIARSAASSRTTNGITREVVQTLAAICEPRLRPPQLMRHMAAPEPVPSGM